MKRILHIIAVITAIGVAVIVIRNFYWYNKMEDNNVSLVLSIPSLSEESSVEILVDDSLYLTNDSFIGLYNFERLNLSCGFHKLKVIVDKKEYTEDFFVFLVRWIYIEIHDSICEEKKVTIDCSFSPVILM